MSKTITWFEIPAMDFERAVAFYENVLGGKIEVTEMGGNPYGFLPNYQEGVGGAITKWPDFRPAQNNTGVLVYFYAENLDEMLGRVERAGGKISTPKAFINEEIGHYATIVDSEGNKIALHQPANQG